MPEEETQEEFDMDAQDLPPGREGADLLPDLTDDDLAATLGFATTLSEQMMPKPEMEGEEGEEPTEDEGDSENLGTVKEEIMDEVDSKIESLRDEVVTDDLRKEFEDVKAQLDELLKEDNGQEPKN